MAYNSFFPATYNPMGYSQMPVLPQYQTPQPTQTQQHGIVWVQGEAGAKAHPVGAGQSALLMDSENNVFYIKSSDVSGMPLPLRIFDYQERNTNTSPATAQNSTIDTSIYVTKEELEKRLEEITGQKKGE